MSSAGSYSKFIGRVGMLAVALGIGSAIAAPQIAWADEGAPSDTTSTSAASDKDSAADTRDDRAATGLRKVSLTVRSVRTAHQPPRETIRTPEDEIEEPAALAVDEVPEVSIPAAAVTPAPDQSASGIRTRDASAPAVEAATIAADPLPSVTAAITGRSPVATRPSSLIRTVLLGVLGIFGFNPERTNNPVLQGIWNTYRRTESQYANIAPDITAVRVLGTSIADDGRIAVRLGFDASDYDGDQFTVFESGEPGLDQNPDGTFTYYTDAGFTGIKQTHLTAVDSGDHFHNFALWDYSGGHYRIATITLTYTAAQPVT